MSTRPSPTVSSTSTTESGSGWQSGIRLLVRFAAMIPASCAVVERVALRQVADAARGLGRHQHRRPRDRLAGATTGLWPTSTILTSPDDFVDVREVGHRA